ncbi:MAG: hypothetical protein NWQ19_05625, partial [Nonlabens sp.]|nr:hypothetical protein [Nonlabens sp.]
MKSILSTICIVLFSLSSIAQTTDFYKEKWSRVRLLELGDRLEDAGKTLDSIESQANKSQDKQQLIKIFLFRSKYSMV